MALIGTIMNSPGSEKASEETLLFNRLRGLGDDRNGHFAVHIHMSALRPSNRKPHFLKIAARTFDNLLSNFDATLFRMWNVDFVLLCREVPIEEVDPVILKIRQLFSEDPLTEGEDGSLDDRFTTWYDLSQPNDFSAFVELSNKFAIEMAERRRQDEQSVSPNALSGARLNPASAGEINLNLQRVKIDDLITEQTAIIIHSGGKGDVMFRELFVSMKELQKRVAPDVNLFGSLWLFQFLTETIDRRVLSVISQRDFTAMQYPISLNLNISSVLGREFQHFRQSVGDNTEKIIVEFQLIDIFSDIIAYTDAREMLQENGYRVLIDGLSPLALEYFDPARLQADLVKISWGQEFESEGSDARIEDMRAVVKKMGADSVILGRTDSEDAVVWALGIGVTRFQGYYIDTVVEAMQAKGII